MNTTTNPLHAPAAHDLPTLFRELKYGRPAEDQDLLEFLASTTEQLSSTPFELSKLAGERKYVRHYLSRLLKSHAPHCEPMPDLRGICTQIDNLVTGTAVAAKDAVRRRQETRDELRQVLLAVDSVLEYDSSNRVANLMLLVKPLIEREYQGISGWGSRLAGVGFTRISEPELQHNSGTITAPAEEATQVVDSGAGEKNRTPNLLITNQVENQPETSQNQEHTQESTPNATCDSVRLDSSTSESVTAPPSWMGDFSSGPDLDAVVVDGRFFASWERACVAMVERVNALRGELESVNSSLASAYTKLAMECTRHEATKNNLDVQTGAANNKIVELRTERDKLRAKLAEIESRSVPPAPTKELVDVYQEFVDEAWFGRRKPDDNKLRSLFIMSVGLGGEAGEVQELLKKHVRDGHLDVDDLMLELGDVAYYLARIASWFGRSLREVLERNRGKLVKRQSTGKRGAAVLPDPEASPVPPLVIPVDRRHRYQNCDGRSACMNGCGAWVGRFSCGGPKDVDPFGECPNYHRYEPGQPGSAFP